MSLDASSETEKPQDAPLTREDIPELVKAVAEALKDRSTPSQGTSRDADDGSSSKTGTSAATGELAKHHNRPCHARCQIYVGSALLNVFYIRERAKLALIQRALHGAYCCCAPPPPILPHTVTFPAWFIVHCFVQLSTTRAHYVPAPLSHSTRSGAG